jgi:hypothetical protein
MKILISIEALTPQINHELIVITKTSGEGKNKTII